MKFTYLLIFTAALFMLLPACREKQNEPPSPTAHATSYINWDDPKSIMAGQPEFSEDEMLKLIADIQTVRNEPIEITLIYLRDEKGWRPERAFYVETKINAAYDILKYGPENRDIYYQEHPEAIPTSRELELVRRNFSVVDKALESQ